MTAVDGMGKSSKGFVMPPPPKGFVPPPPFTDAPFVPPPFSIGDTVFTIENDSVVTFVIGRITMVWQEKFCTYQVGTYSGGRSSGDCWDMRDASRCFRTKAELLASL